MYELNPFGVSEMKAFVFSGNPESPNTSKCNYQHTTYKSYYKSANLCPSVFPSVDLHENRSNDSLQTRPMCCPEPDDVQYDLSLYGCGKIIELNDLCVLFAVPSPLTLLSAIPPTVAHSIALLAGDTGRSAYFFFLPLFRAAAVFN